MKQKLLRFVVCLMMLSVCAIPVSADIGPKPSVVITFEGLEGQTYYATLLSKREVYGPWNPENEWRDAYGPETVDQAFRDYEDPDGYYFQGYFQDCTQTQVFSWGYYPPQEFKVLLYFPDSGEFRGSPGSFEQYAFDSYYDAKTVESEVLMQGQEKPVTVKQVFLKKDYPYGWELVSLACRCVATIGVELLLGWLFLFRGKQLFRLICVTNVTTQVLLNLALNYLNYQRGYYAFVAWYILLELMVFLLEAGIYWWYLRRHPQEQKLHPVLYALCANAVSFGVGMAVSRFVPGIF